MAKAIKVEGLSKAYQLGDFGTGTISRDIERFWARLRGKEDPFLRIGEINDRTITGESDVVWSLKDINFEIEQGDAVGIIGRNGAGKSTLLKILSRVTSPSVGSVKVKGRIASLLEVGTGFHPELSGRENIYLNGAILGMRKKEITQKFDEIVDFAGVERYIDTPVKRYSSGMYVRLAFAVAAHLESEILIVDEVLAVGDAEFQKKCLGKMGDVSKGEGRTVLFVSHNMDAVKVLCNKGIVLDRGLIYTNGSIDHCCEKYLNINSKSLSKGFSLKDLILTTELNLNLFAFDKRVYKQTDQVNIAINISSNINNNISGSAVLIYNAFDVRVGIIDLRKLGTDKLNNIHSNISMNIKVDTLPLIPGIYKIGLWLDSKLYTGNFLDLLNIEIEPSLDEFIRYPDSVLGYLSPIFSGDVSYE